jgi:hypothetical protein
MQKYKKLSMRCIFLYLFICYLTTLIPLIEYAQRKRNQIIPKTLTYKYTYLFILYFYTDFGLYKSYPLKRNLVLEISKKGDIGGMVCNLAFLISSKIKSLSCFIH